MDGFVNVFMTDRSTLVDWLTLVVLSINLIVIWAYTCYTRRIMKSTREGADATNESARIAAKVAEYQMRPIVGVDLMNYVSRAHIALLFTNYTRTDALGLVRLIFWLEDDPFNVTSRGYHGEKVWSFPAKQGCNGHIDLSPVFELVGDRYLKMRLKMRVDLCYAKWDGKLRKPMPGEYYAPPKMWEWSVVARCWVSLLTHDTIPEIEEFNHQLLAD